MAEPIDQPGGLALFNTNQRVDSTDLSNVGAMAEQSIWDGFVARVLDGANGFFGADCLPSKGAGDLDYLVEPGVGVFKDTAEADAFQPVYKPIFVASQQSGTLGAHDPTNPRIDILTLAPATVDDESDTRKILTAGVLTPTSVDLRRRRAFTLAVVAGTPSGSPSAPATPAGTIKIAEIDVPATSGPITVNDVRPIVGTVEDGIADGAVTTDKIPDQAITGAKLASSAATWMKVTAIGAESSNTRQVDFQLQDLDGNSVLRTQRFVATVYKDNGDAVTADATALVSVSGNQLSNGGFTAAARVVGETDSLGAVGIDVEDQTTVLSGSLWLHVQPVCDDGATPDPGEATVVEVTFT